MALFCHLLLRKACIFLQASLTMDGTRRRKQIAHAAELGLKAEYVQKSSVEGTEAASQSSYGCSSNSYFKDAEPLQLGKLTSGFSGQSAATENVGMKSEQLPSFKGLQLLQPCNKSLKNIDEGNQETVWEFTLEVFIPFIIAGLGMTLAGLALDTVRVCINVYFM